MITPNFSLTEYIELLVVEIDYSKLLIAETEHMKYIELLISDSYT